MKGEFALGQADVEHDIVEVLSHGRVLTTQEITREVKARVHLRPLDRQRANERPNESKIDQIIANALQERRSLCRKGLIERVAVGEFRITESGSEYLRDFALQLEQAMTLLDDLMPDDE
jgi:Mrr N-terminal domain